MEMKGLFQKKRITFLTSSFLFISLLLFSGCEIPSNFGGEELTLEQAGLLVYQQVIETSANKDYLVIHIWPEKLKKGDLVFSEFGTEVAFKVNGQSWFFWIDDEPEARFAHKNRFVLVDARKSKVSTVESGFWPFINEYSMWDGSSEINSETKDAGAEGNAITGA